MSTANTRFRTAVHALAVIAYVPEQQASSDQIAASVSTDPSVVRRLLSQLAQAGLVQGAAGRAGGYVLGRHPKKITLKDIHDAIATGDLFPTPERLPNRTCPVGSRIHAVLDAPLAEARRALDDGLAKTSLADLLVALRQP